MTHRGLLHHTLISVSDMSRSSPFYTGMFEYLGYDLAGSNLSDGSLKYEDWKRWDTDTPHEISICEANERHAETPHVPGAVGHHHHMAFCAIDRADIDRFYTEVLVPLQDQGLCEIEDPPCDCPGYGEGYYATFFRDPDGLKYEYVLNPNHLRKRAERESTT